MMQELHTLWKHICNRLQRGNIMVKFRFTVRDPEGFPVETAGQFVKEAIQCTSKVTIRKGEKSGDAKLIFHVLSLSIKAGQEIEVVLEGEKEQEEAKRLKMFIREHIGV